MIELRLEALDRAVRIALSNRNTEDDRVTTGRADLFYAFLMADNRPAKPTTHVAVNMTNPTKPDSHRPSGRVVDLNNL